MVFATETFPVQRFPSVVSLWELLQPYPKWASVGGETAAVSTSGSYQQFDFHLEVSCFLNFSENRNFGSTICYFLQPKLRGRQKYTKFLPKIRMRKSVGFNAQNLIAKLCIKGLKYLDFLIN
jgi:hypothetical protein